MIHLTQLKIGKTIRNNFKINKIKEMSIAAIKGVRKSIKNSNFAPQNSRRKNK